MKRIQLLAALLVLAALALPASALADEAPSPSPSPCPNEAARTSQFLFNGHHLPDCRTYQQVSPVNSNGADAKGFPGQVEASLSGGRFSFYSIAAFPQGCAVDGSYPVYLSSRGAGEAWGTEGIIPCEAEAAKKLGFSEDLSEAEVEAKGVPLAAGASAGWNVYVRYSEPGEGQPRYRWLAHPSPGDEEETRLFFAGFSGDDQHLVVESEQPLAAGSVAGAPNAFEADLAGPEEGQWSLVGVIPHEGQSSCSGSECAAPAGGSVIGAGAYYWPAVASALGEQDAQHFTQGAVSSDGSRVFFMALPSGRLFVREDGERTVAVSKGVGHFRSAAPDGSFAFYTEGEELYRFDTASEVSEPVAVTATGKGDVTAGSMEVTGLAVTAGAVFHVGEGLFGAGLAAGTKITSVGAHSLGLSLAAGETHAGDALSGTPADVVGVLGSSADGSVVYFAAGGRFAENSRKYEFVNAKGEHEHASETPAGEEEVHQGGEELVNLYEWYQPPSTPPVVTFIARLASTRYDDDPDEEGRGDEEDWSDFLGDDYPETKTSRVSVGGETLLFSSRRALTGYDNSGPCDAGLMICAELFRYRAGSEGALGRVTCVSCNPDPALAPRGDALLVGQGEGPRDGGEEGWLGRNLSADGDRVFFDSPDALVPEDTDSPTPNVYEWEADGEGGCESSAQDEGCLYLISSGTSNEQSYFGDASANGDDVFFFTRQELVPSSEGGNFVVYDAHECLVHEACEETPHVNAAECTGEGCATSPYSTPPVPDLLSAAPAGSGNLPEPPASTGGGQGASHKLSTAQKLAAALKKCRAKHDKHKRQVCEAQAHKRYPVKAASRKGAKGR
jgi:hypothetical protein